MEIKSLQPEFFSLIEEMITKNKKISHAYLIETNNVEYTEIVNVFIKTILNSKKELTTIEENLIDKGNYDDILNIYADGQWIKKEQVLEIQTKFSTKSVNNNYRIYIIHEANKLNKSSANALLKFLEEPEQDIIAVLLTNNKHDVIETILSRCQVLTLSNKAESIFNKDELINKEKYLDLIEIIEKKETQAIAYGKDLISEIISSKNELSLFLQFMLKFYKIILDYKLERNISNYIDLTTEKTFLVVEKTNSIEKTIHKIKILSDLEKRLNYNMNMNLCIDQLIIKLSGGSNERSNRNSI